MATSATEAIGMRAPPAGVRLLLARHAHTDALGASLSGRTPVPLNAEGTLAAERLALRLAGEGVGAIAASPQRRARETAEPLARMLGLQVVAEPALDEIDFGRWAGQPFAALDPLAEWRAWNADRGRTAPPGGESMAEVKARLLGWLARVAAGPSAVVAAFSHSDVVKAAISLVLGLPAHFHDRLQVAPAAFATIQLLPWGWRLLALEEARA